MKGSRKRNGGKWFFIILAVVIVGAALVGPLTQGALRMLYPLSYEDRILECAQKYNVDPYLIMGLIKAESNFIPDARSHKDAMGLMQLTDSTAQWVAGQVGLANYSPELLLDPDINIGLGVWYLAYLMGEYDGDNTLALCAYNAGMGNVGKWLANEKYSSDGKTLHTIPFADTRCYVDNTQEYAQMYRKLYPDLTGCI